MHVKSLIIGFVVGAVLTTAVYFIFGDRIRGGIAHTTEALGQKVKGVGESLEDAGDRMK